MIPELIDHLWQSTLFVGAAWLLTLGLKKNRAQVRYWIWLTEAPWIKLRPNFSQLIGRMLNVITMHLLRLSDD